MFYDRILVKYGELTIKGKNKQNFINQTIKTIKEKCARFTKLEYISNYERFFIILNGEDHLAVVKALDKVFGLHSYSLCTKCESNMESIIKQSVEVVKNELTESTTFKVETSRVDKRFPLLSLEVSKEVARNVLKTAPHLIVNVKDPLVTMKIEIRAEATYIYTHEFPGLGGLPVGIDGKGLLMLSGGIDSPVAGFLIQKRGVAIDVIHFASPPFTSERSKEKVLDLTQKLAAFSPKGKINVHIVPFTKLQKAIYDNCPKNYTITILRRMMYRIAEIVAKKINALILVNGESVGQVASQTLYSMNVINSVTNQPIIRPVATMDKSEIIIIAKKIATYDISIRPFEDCCTIFVPENPVTKPELDKCIEYEGLIDFNPLLNECIANMETVVIKEDENHKNTALIEELF